MKEKVLSEMGVAEPHNRDGKTPLMLLIESRHGQSIELLIASGNVRRLAKALGVHYATISKWRHQLGISD